MAGARIYWESMDRATPKDIREHSESELAITWADGHVSVYPVRFLRLHCTCAGCIDERTGKKVLVDEKIPMDVRHVTIHPTGRYGLNIVWSDGHSAGIFTFDHLRELCPCCHPALS